MTIDYDTLPIKIFFKILKDQENNLHLLGIKDLKEAKKVWEGIKNEFQERHPSKDSRDLVEAQRKVVKNYVELNKLFLLLEISIKTISDKKVFFEKAKYKYIEDENVRAEKLISEINKKKTTFEIFDARLKKLEKDLEENRVDEDIDADVSLSILNESIASLELLGFTIENYQTLTCGKYDAMSKVLKNKK